MADLYFNELCRKAGRRDIEAGSAGIYAWNGSPISPQAAAGMEKFGIDAFGFRATRFTPELARKYDLLIAMTASHAAAMAELAPSEAEKIRLLVGDGVPDPFGGSVEHYLTVFESAMKPALEELFRAVAGPEA